MAPTDSVEPLLDRPERPTVELVATLGEGDGFVRALERAGYTARGFLDHHAWLHGCVRTTVRARALEPFEVAEVEATCSRVAAMADELAEVERALARGSEDPYR